MDYLKGGIQGGIEEVLGKESAIYYLIKIEIAAKRLKNL